MHKLSLVAALMLTSGCSPPPPLSTAHMPSIVGEGDPPCLRQSQGGQCVLYDASFIQLVARPDVYDGKRILVGGYLNLEFEGNALYLSEEMYEHGSLRDAIWLNLEGFSSPLRFRRGYAWVEGTFTAGPGGHFGMFSGTIGNIARLEARGK